MNDVADRNKRQGIRSINAGGRMEAVYFLVLWVGAATVHTLYELKVKRYLAQFRRDPGNWPFI